MQLSEKEIEDLVFRDLIENDGCDLNDRGLTMPFLHLRIRSDNEFNNRIKWVRQLDVQPYGIIDIVGFYRYRGMIHADLLELKAVPIECKDFDQIFRYKKGLEVFARQTFKNINILINPVLIGYGYNTGYYIQNNASIIVSEFSYGLDGFSFSSHHGFASWALKNDQHCNFKNLVDRRPSKVTQSTNGKAVY